METNVSFKSNVNIIKSKSTLKGDEEFLKKVTDYYALYKLMVGPCGGNCPGYPGGPLQQVESHGSGRLPGAADSGRGDGPCLKGF